MFVKHQAAVKWTWPGATSFRWPTSALPPPGPPGPPAAVPSYMSVPVVQWPVSTVQCPAMSVVWRQKRRVKSKHFARHSFDL